MTTFDFSMKYVVLLGIEWEVFKQNMLRVSQVGGRGVRYLGWWPKYFFLYEPSLMKNLEKSGKTVK